MAILEDNKPLSTGIKVLIAKKGYRNSYVAGKANYTAQELSDMLNGRRLIKACDIPRLADALGVTADEIYAAGKEVGSDAE